MVESRRRHDKRDGSREDWKVQSRTEEMFFIEGKDIFRPEDNSGKVFLGRRRGNLYNFKYYCHYKHVNKQITDGSMRFKTFQEQTRDK